MDRNRRKEVRKYVAAYLLFFVLFSAFMFILGKYEIGKNQQKMFVLMKEHPELEAEIIALWEKPNLGAFGDIRGTEMEKMIEILEDKYGYANEDIFSETSWWVFWGIGVAAGAAADCLNCKKLKDSRENLRVLYEHLEQLRRGEFGNVPDYEGDHEGNSKEWAKIWESLRELGVYFEGLKRTLKEEENSTKALITDISHQLKTPLASLRMSYELAVGDQLTQEERREFKEQEKQEIEKLETLLKELVDLSRLETHMIRLNPSKESLKKTIAGAVSQVYMKARNKDMEIQVDMEADMEIFHDRKWTEEALVNVLDNSVKYSGEHTNITVRVTPLAMNVLIEVEDEGIGIRTEELYQIYQRFYRGEDAKKTEEEGAGVGLYLARMILERQGGAIYAKQKAPKGTVFRITLPY